MNWLGFVRLIKWIYYDRGLPDLDAIQGMGLLAVKIGQMHALRIDLLEPEKCRHLSQLYRRTVTIAPEAFSALLDSYTAGRHREWFRSVSGQPLACASVGQVHRATLKDGREVAVKLVKGDFRDDFLRDVKSIRRFVNAVLTVYPKLQRVANPRGILDHIEQYTVSELDLRNELQGQGLLEKIHAEHRDRFQLSALAFHRLFPEYSNENVLVSEFLEGKTFDELLDEGALPYELLLELFHVHGFYMFGIGMFHGDIHPGNVLLKDGRMYFLDTGSISTVDDQIRMGLFRFMEALSFFSYEDCAARLNEMSETPIDGKAYGKFRRDFLELYKDFSESTVSDVSLTKKMYHTIKLGVNAGMEFNQGMFAIIKSLMYMDGMVLKCNPQAVLMKDMRKFIGELKPQVARPGLR